MWHFGSCLAPRWLLWAQQRHCCCLLLTTLLEVEERAFRGELSLWDSDDKLLALSAFGDLSCLWGDLLLALRCSFQNINQTLMRLRFTCEKCEMSYYQLRRDAFYMHPVHKSFSLPSRHCFWLADRNLHNVHIERRMEWWLIANRLSGCTWKTLRYLNW